MSACLTCGGFDYRHDPVAHGNDWVCGFCQGEGCDWCAHLCSICGDEHEPRCRNRREPGDPEWTARELMSGLPGEDDRGFFTYDEHGRRVTE